MPKWYERTGSQGGRAQAGRRLPGCLVLIALLLLAVLLRSAWLPLVARVLVVDQQPREADAIMVMGGGDGSSQDRAIQLYQEGWAPILVSSGEPPNLPGTERSYAELGADYMIQRGIPSEAILMVPQTTSTHDEARICLSICKERDFGRLVVVTDHYHTLRTSLTFRQVFRGQGIEITHVAAQPEWFDLDRWWQSERPVLAVFQEYLKLGYYFVKGYII